MHGTLRSMHSNGEETKTKQKGDEMEKWGLRRRVAEGRRGEREGKAIWCKGMQKRSLERWVEEYAHIKCPVTVYATPYTMTLSSLVKCNVFYPSLPPTKHFEC